MTMIVDLITQRIKTQLEADMQAVIAQTDDSYVFDIQIGRYKSNPITVGTYLSVLGGLSDEMGVLDGVVTLEEFDKIGLRIPPREFPSRTYWYRRGMVEVGCYFVSQGFTQAEAQATAYDILGRATRSVENTSMAGLTDDYSETALSIYVYATTFTESGGAGKYIWRGHIRWAVLTSR